MNSSTNIVHVDSAEHAESVIKSLRSASLSQRRYQRIAEAGESIFTNLANFDSVVATQLKETKQKEDIDAKINATPIVARGFVKEASADSDDETPRFVSIFLFLLILKTSVQTGLILLLN